MGATAAIGMAVLGGAVSANSSMQSGQANQDLMNYNANIADLRAEDSLSRGRTMEQRQRMLTRQTIGSTRAAAAASGVVVDQPDSTVGNIISDQARLGELDALTIRSNAAREAWGYNMQAQDYRRRGEISKMEGKNRAIGQVLSTGGSVLGAKYGFGGK